jgi:hypothetical protein
MKTSLILAVSLAALFASCSKSSESDSKGEAPSKETAAAPSKVAAAVATSNPCDLLTEAVVRKHLGLAEDVELNQKLSNLAGFPHCSYSWSTLTPEEEKERKAALANSAMARVQSQGEAQGIVDMAMRQSLGTGSAHLTLAKEMDSEEAAIAALASARKFMESREKARVGNEDADFISSFVDVEGVGAKAHYSSKQHQLSFVRGKRLFHLGVKSHQEADGLALAKAIANDILK